MPPESVAPTIKKLVASAMRATALVILLSSCTKLSRREISSTFSLVGSNQSIVTKEDTRVSISLDARSQSGRPVKYEIVSPPGHGELLGDAPNFEYTPHPNYFGTDTIRYRATAGEETKDFTFTIVIDPVGDVPIAQAAQLEVAEDRVLTASLQANHEVGDHLAFVLLTAPTKGTAQIANDTGTVTYTPNVNANGADSFTFTVSNQTGVSIPATVSVNISPANDAPSASNAVAYVVEDLIYRGALVGTDIDGDPLNFSIVTQPANATVRILDSALGTYEVVPRPNYNGSDIFTFRVSDGQLTATGAVSLNISAANDAPVAAAQSRSMDEDDSLTGSFSATDADTADRLTFSAVTNPAHGALSIVASTGSFTYRPNGNFHGTDQFTFQASDGRANSSPARVTLTIRPKNDAPVAQPTSLSGNEDTAIAGTLLANDVDQGDALTYSIVSQPSHGTVSLTAATGRVVYTPAAQFSGSDLFQFRVSDGTLNSAPATASINVVPVNDRPVAQGVSKSTFRGIPVRLTLVATDIDSTNLSYSIVDSPQHGSLLVLNASTGLVQYTSADNYSGSDTFTFKASDGSSDSNIARATITVRPYQLALGKAFQNVPVLQRGVQAAIWGTQSDLAKLQVQILNQSDQIIASSAEVNADSTNGTWRVSLTIPASEKGNYKLRILSESASLMTVPIMVGDVWLCSGQSNMNFQVSTSDVPLVNDAGLRLLYYPPVGSDTPAPSPEVRWTDSYKNFSAVCYGMGVTLRQNGVPIGLIAIAKGGTLIEEWMPRGVLREVDTGQGHPHSHLFNGTLHSLRGYGLKGVAWYQGESNAAAEPVGSPVVRATRYLTLLPALIRSWRSEWAANGGSGDFYFGIIELSAAGCGISNNAVYAELRLAQRKVASLVNRTFFVPTFDLGKMDPSSPCGTNSINADIHPPFKRAVGERAGNLILGSIMGVSGKPTLSPHLRSAAVSGSKIQMSFNSNGPITIHPAFTGNALQVCCDAAGAFVPVSDQGWVVSSTGTLLVDMPSGIVRLTTIRYAFANVVHGPATTLPANLVNRDSYAHAPLRDASGLPVTLFATDLRWFDRGVYIDADTVLAPLSSIRTQAGNLVGWACISHFPIPASFQIVTNSGRALSGVLQANLTSVGESSAVCDSQGGTPTHGFSIPISSLSAFAAGESGYYVRVVPLARKDLLQQN